MHRGSRTHSSPWYTFLSPRKVQQLFSRAYRWFSHIAVTCKTHSRVLHPHVLPPEVTHHDVTLPIHSHQIPSTNPRGGSYRLCTHTWSSPNVLLNVFSYMPKPIQLFSVKSDKWSNRSKTTRGSGDSSNTRDMQMNSIIELMHHSHVQIFLRNKTTL